MTKLLVALLLLLAILAAAVLTESYIAGIALGMILLPTIFLSSMLFARLINLDRKVGISKVVPPDTRTKNS